jgi:hypothetical protein
MGRTWPLVLAMLGACGRIGFDGPTAAGGDSAPSNDAASDASTSGIAFVGSPIQHTGTMGATDTATFNATRANDALLFLVACAGSQLPTSVALSAPGWTFTALAPLTANLAGQVYAASFGAVAPDTQPATLTVTWTGGNCNRGKSILADELTHTDPTGGTTTFDSFASAMGAGDCTTSVTTGHANDAVWAACYAATAVSGVGAGYTMSAADSVGDLAEYKLTTDPPNTVEQVTFANPNGYVVVAATIKPLP